MAQQRWKLSGNYFESCNCDVICGCLIQSPPSRVRCDAALAFHIDQGSYGPTKLDDLNTVLVVSFPGPGKMRDGNWAAALYVDERASGEQQDALGTIFSGKAGGRPQILAGLISRFLGVKAAPIKYEVQGHRRRVTIPDILTVDINAITGVDGAEPLWATNAAHPVSSKLALAKNTEYRYSDHNLAWDSPGTNGHFAPFAWEG